MACGFTSTHAAFVADVRALTRTAREKGSHTLEWCLRSLKTRLACSSSHKKVLQSKVRSKQLREQSAFTRSQLQTCRVYSSTACYLNSVEWSRCLRRILALAREMLPLPLLGECAANARLHSIFIKDMCASVCDQAQLVGRRQRQQRPTAACS